MNTKEPLTRYNLKLPHELGKVVYAQSFDVKQHIRSQIPFRIFQLLFCAFGFAISLLMLYSGWQHEDVWHGLIGILFFPFLFVIILIIKDLLRTTLIIVCDKGIARFTLNYTLAVVYSEFLYFKDVTHYTEQEGFVDPNSPVSKKGYLYKTAWFNGNVKVFDIHHFKEDEIKGYHLDKEAAQEAKKAFNLFCTHP